MKIIATFKHYTLHIFFTYVLIKYFNKIIFLSVKLNAKIISKQLKNPIYLKYEIVI